MTAAPTILVVDDNAAALKATARILSQAGYEVAQAADGMDGLRQIRALRPSLVLLDAVLPDISGPEVLRQIRADPALAGISVVMLSAQQISPEQQAGGLDAGADGYIARPIANAELLARVRLHLRQHELTRLLRASDQQFASAFADAPNGMALVAPDGRWLKVNRALCELVGYTEAGLLARTFQDITHPEDLATDLEYVRQMLAGEIRFYQMEKRYIHARGHLVTVILSVSLVSDADGGPGYFIVQIQDITARQVTEQALRASEVHFRFLNDLNEATRALADPAQIMAAMARLLGGHLRASRCAYADVEPDGERFTILDDYTDGCASTVGRYQLSLFGTQAVAKLHRGETLIIRNVPAELLPADGADMFGAIGIQAIISCPLVKEGRLRALMAVHQTAPRDWQPNEVSLVQEVVERCWATIQRRAAEAALRDSEHRYQSLAENSPAGIFRTDPHGQTTYVNARWCELAGLSAAEALGEGWLRAIHPEDREALVSGWREASAAHGTSEADYRLRRPDGSVTWVVGRSIPDKDAEGRFVGYTGTITDITERKRAEESLRRQQTELRVLFDLMPAMIWFKDTANGILRVNQRVADAAGKPVEEIEGKSSREIYPEEAARFYADDLEVIRSGMPKLGYVEAMQGREGQELWVQTDKVPYRDVDGKVIGIVVMAQDITARKRTEVELEQTHEKLLAASRQAGMAEFATGILHNVGNVLNSVTVASTCVADSLRRSKAANLAKVVALLREHEKDLGDFFTRDPKGRRVPEYLAHLAEELTGEQSRALNELAELQTNIQHIRDIVTTQQGMARRGGKEETIDVTNLVEDALRINLTAVARHNIAVRTAYGDVPPVVVEKTKALQILVNLVRNAKQACETSDQLEKKLTIRTTAADGRVRIAVTDNGVGIPPENLQRIFTLGFTTKQDGHGFGLHSGALAAKELGGSLSAHSDGPGRGATFILELPGRVEPPEIRAAAKGDHG